MIELKWFEVLLGLFGAYTFGWFVGYMCDIEKKRKQYKEIGKVAYEIYKHDIDVLEEKRKKENEID